MDHDRYTLHGAHAQVIGVYASLDHACAVLTVASTASGEILADSLT